MCSYIIFIPVSIKEMLKAHSLYSMFLVFFSFVANKRKKKYMDEWWLCENKKNLKHLFRVNWLNVSSQGMGMYVSIPLELMLRCLFLRKWANCATEEKCIYGQTYRHDINVKR